MDYNNTQLWTYLYIFLSLTQILLLFKILSQGKFTNHILWILYFIGMSFSLMSILVCIGRYEILTYVTTLISNVFLYSSFIYSQSNKSFGNSLLVNVGVYLMFIPATALLFYSNYNIFHI